MPEVVKKKDPYAHRRSLGVTVEEEYASDTDFAPGPYVPTPAKPKTKRLTKKRGSGKTKRSSLSDEDEDEESEPERKKKKVSSRRRKIKAPQHKPIGANLLLELFAKAGFGVHYSSGEEAEDEEEEEEEEEWSGSERPDSPPPVLKATLPSKQPAPAPPPNDADSVTEEESDPQIHSKPGSLNKSSANREEDSVTEEESDPPAPSIPTEEQPAVSQDASETEEESDAPPPSKPAAKQVSTNQDDSVTESESDEPSQSLKRKASHVSRDSSPTKRQKTSVAPLKEVSAEDLVWKLKPKPDFALKPGQARLDKLTLDAEQGIFVPAPINTHLRPYQRDGINFFWRQYKAGYGGLLGDDMGLGKTIQVISFLSAIMKKTGTIKDENRRRMHVSRLQDLPDWHERRYLPPANETWPTCLIIAPSTVCHNWQREFETWGYFEVGMYTGEREVRKDVLKEFKMGRLDVVVTSFDLALRDIEDLKDEAWSCVIIDEVHRVKNEKSNTTQAFHTFPQRGRFGLTGTTIQNSYNEMWNILDWTNPGRVGTSKEWVKYVTKPLTSGQSASATDKQRAMKQLVANTLTNELLPQLFLRRTKEVIRNRLPKKFDNVVFCPLTNFQIGAYKRVLEMDGVQNLVKRDEPCDCGSNNKRKECCHPFDAKDMFKFMTILIKISNHLALIMPGSDDTPEQAQRNQEVCDVIFPHENPSQDLAFLQPQLCGKWKTLAALLKDWRKDPTNKVLIFTKSIKLLNMLDHHIKTRSYGYLRLDGSTKQSDRMATIDKFQKDPDIFIFLISTLAGGTGLNLTAANKVVVFDPNWNPAHDLQAMDRAFRFGQERDVTVVRLLGAGSVEELIYARQIYKQQQMAIGYEASVQTRYFDGVQGDTTKRGELFGLENIFSLQEDKMPTKFIIEEAKVAEIDWAHANSGGPRKKRQSGTNADVLEAESQIGGEDAELKGLASFLFDDALAPKPNTAQDNLQKVLAGAGAMYSHVNDEVLAESRMEKEKLSKPTKGTRQRKGATTGKKSPAKELPGPWWPPRRKHHKKEETVEFKIQARRDAFVAKGLINSFSTEADLAKRMKATMTNAEREALFKEMDAWRPPA